VAGSWWLVAGGWLLVAGRAVNGSVLTFDPIENELLLLLYGALGDSSSKSEVTGSIR
jgi:hypothetical protein